MDDQTGTSTTAKVVLSASSFLVAVLLARAAFGDVGVQTVLLGTMALVAALAWCQLTERPLPRLAQLSRGSDDPPAPVVEDTWRSERWIAEAVDRGLRALEEWRLEQREA